MILTCRNHCSRRERKRLYPHPARKPDGMNICSLKGDDLSHCVVRARHLSTVQARKYNTTATLSTQSASFAGSDSTNVQSEGRFQGISYMANKHMVLSMMGGPDINELAHLKVNEGKWPRDCWTI